MHRIIILVCVVPIALSTPPAYAQYFGNGSGPVTQEEKDFCKQYEIVPCTQNNIEAKERLLAVRLDSPFECPKFAGVCIDNAAVGAILIAVAGSIIALVLYRELRKHQPASP